VALPSRPLLIRDAAPLDRGPRPDQVNEAVRESCRARRPG
jgi:hypothetical protein